MNNFFILSLIFSLCANYIQFQNYQIGIKRCERYENLAKKLEIEKIYLKKQLPFSK